MRAISLSVVVVQFIIASSASALTITINDNSACCSVLRTGAFDFDGGPDMEEDLFPTVLPYEATSTSATGLSSSTSSYNLSSSGFNITFDHARNNTTGFSQGTSSGFIWFSIDQDANYVASGSYSAIDPSGRMLQLWSGLQDDTANVVMFESVQRSLTTANESFTLGLSEGDDSNISLGSLSGTLTAGHDYRFNYSGTLHANSSPTAATASGFVSLILTPVPEPSTALLLGSGFIGLAASRRR